MEKSREKGPARTARRWATAAMLLAAGGLLLARCASVHGKADGKRMIVLGIDGLDPELLHRYERDGKMPNFAALEATGDFRPLRTSIPPQSPVAWSNLITGMNPGGHGIFDFIHRDPKTMLPYLSTSRVDPPRHTVTLGKWVIPVSSGGATLLRQGRAFWQILAEHRIPATVFHMPANFPPVKSKSRTMAGMGTPDMLGTYGTFSFYTSDPLANAGSISGGRIYSVEVRDSRVSAKLFGPHNTLRKGSPQTTVDFTVSIDPVESVAKIAIQNQEILLREGEWSDWVRLEFVLVPGLDSGTGICKFYLKQAHPFFQLYVTPVNIDPSDPALPLSTPEDYSNELWKEAGFFYTQGIAEDTKALSDGVLSDGEYLEQARMVLAEQLEMFNLELQRFRTGFLFFYFSSLDQNAHMFWRAMDPHHPAYTPQLAASYSGVLEDFYQEMDRVLGKTVAKLDGNTTLLVVSDHGFAPYYRSFNLNTWLLENGYTTLKDGMAQGGADIFTGVDWLRTRAYGLGLNGLYLNLRGREQHGIVQPGAEAEALREEITRKLLALRDPVTGLAPITRVDKAEDVYTGPFVQNAPDLIIGYNRGYRAGWGTVLGQFAWDVLEDNTEAWSGDHCMDYTLVPGVLLSNKKIVAEAPALTDVAPTILAGFGIEKPKDMIGQSVLGPAVSARR